MIPFKHILKDLGAFKFSLSHFTALTTLPLPSKVNGHRQSCNIQRLHCHSTWEGGNRSWEWHMSSDSSKDSKSKWGRGWRMGRGMTASHGSLVRNQSDNQSHHSVSDCQLMLQQHSASQGAPDYQQCCICFMTNQSSQMRQMYDDPWRTTLYIWLLLQHCDMKACNYV